jgi:Uma2 family endonuclease
MAVEITRHAFSVHDYARMRESGILSEDDRVELIDGEIRTMSPIGPLHAAIVRKIVKYLTTLVAEQAIVSPQNPVQLNDYSEPEPDIAILQPRSDNYAHAHPRPDDIIIIIEVSDSTVQYDRTEKLPRYAAANIAEAWIIDVAQQTIEQYTQPMRGEYARMKKVFFGDIITSSSLPGITLDTSDIFG